MFGPHVRRAALAPALIAPQGLIGYWPLDISSLDFVASKAYDRSGRGNNGTLTNFSSASLVSAKIRQGLLGNGTQSTSGSYISIPSSALFNSLPSFTFSAWVNLKSYNAQYPAILAKKTTANGSSTDPFELYSFGIDPSGHPYVGVSTGVAASRKFLTGSGTVGLNGSHMVCGRWDGATLSLFLDGQIDATTLAAAISMGTNNFPMLIGSEQGGTGSFGTVNGVYSQVRLYSRALSAQEILSIYIAGLSGRA